MIPYKDLNPSRKFPWMTILLIAANVAVFVHQILLPRGELTPFLYRYAVIPLEFRLGHNLRTSPDLLPVFSVFTAMFLHGGWLHLIGNMLYLWIFGDNVEERMGRLRFLFFYLLCGVVATFAQIYADMRSAIPALGASGAIAGILAAYLRLFPRAKIAVLVPIFVFLRSVILPAWLVLGFWVLLQVLQLRTHPMSGAGGIAWFAHVGGFAAGLLLMPIFVRKGRR